jgi:hypothetical protein
MEVLWNHSKDGEVLGEAESLAMCISFRVSLSCEPPHEFLAETFEDVKTLTFKVKLGILRKEEPRLLEVLYLPAEVR